MYSLPLMSQIQEKINYNCLFLQVVLAFSSYSCFFEITKSQVDSFHLQGYFLLTGLLFWPTSSAYMRKTWDSGTVLSGAGHLLGTMNVRSVAIIASQRCIGDGMERNKEKVI